MMATFPEYFMHENENTRQAECEPMNTKHLGHITDDHRESAAAGLDRRRELTTMAVKLSAEIAALGVLVPQEFKYLDCVLCNLLLGTIDD